MDHMGPQLIIKEKVWKDVIPPMMVCSRLVLPLLTNSMEGILGDLKILLSISLNRNKEGNHLVCCWVMSPPRHQGMNPVIPMLNLTKKPTHGQFNGWTRYILSKDGRSNDGMLRLRHRWSSVLSEMGQGKLMGSIHCARIPFILVTINQSHLLPLSKSYSANPLIDLRNPHQYQYCWIVLCHDSHDPLCLQSLCSMFSIFLCHNHILSHLHFAIWQFCLLSAPLWFRCLHIPYWYLFLANWSMHSPALNSQVYN